MPGCGATLESARPHPRAVAGYGEEVAQGRIDALEVIGLCPACAGREQA